MFFNIDKQVSIYKNTKVSACCQGHTRATPGTTPNSLGVGVPDGGLARPIKKSTERKKYKPANPNYYEPVSIHKTQKCQPPVRDTPGPLQGPHPTVLGVGVPDGGLARPIKKSTERKIYKTANPNYNKLVSTKNTKVSASCQGHTRATPGTTPNSLGCGCP